MAPTTIFQAILEDMLLLLAEKETAKEAWDTLKMMHLRVNRVQEVRVHNTKSEFENLRMKGIESVDNFAMKLTSIVSKIRCLGDKMEESFVVIKFLLVVPGEFAPVITTLEQFKDLKAMAMMVEELIGRLKAHKEGIHRYGGGEEEHLLLTMAEWWDRTATKSEGEPSSKARGNGSRCDRGCGCRRGRNGSSRRSDKQRPTG